jgi:hypothetical protein
LELGQQDSEYTEDYALVTQHQISSLPEQIAPTKVPVPKPRYILHADSKGRLSDLCTVLCSFRIVMSYFNVCHILDSMWQKQGHSLFSLPVSEAHIVIMSSFCNEF